MGPAEALETCPYMVIRNERKPLLVVDKELDHAALPWRRYTQKSFTEGHSPSFRLNEWPIRVQFSKFFKTAGTFYLQITCLKIGKQHGLKFRQRPNFCLYT